VLRSQAPPVCQVEKLLLSDTVRSHSGQCTLMVSLCQDLPAPQTCLEMGVKPVLACMSSEKWLLISAVVLGDVIGLQCPQSKEAEKPLNNG
jgi:hypothetical protein